MTKNNIIVAALRLFLMRGYKSVSLVDVADEVGITKGGIYHYFASKDELMHAALHFFLDCFGSKAHELLRGSAGLREALQSLLVDKALEAHMEELLGPVDTSDIDLVHFALEMMRLFPDVQTRVESSQDFLFTALADKIRQAVGKGEVREDVDVSAFAAVLVTLLNGQKPLGKDLATRATRQRMVDCLWALISCRQDSIYGQLTGGVR